MGSSESIVYIDITKSGKLFSEGLDLFLISFGLLSVIIKNG